MLLQEKPLAQQSEQKTNLTTIEQSNQQIINQEKQSEIPLSIPISFQRNFHGGVCKLLRRNRSFKMNIHFYKLDERSANSIEELFTRKLQAQDITIYISNDYMSKDMKDLFKKAKNLYDFLFKFIGTEKVNIDREKMHLIVNQDKQLAIIFAQEIELQKQKNKVLIEVDKLQDKLYLFRNQQIDYLNSVSMFFQTSSCNKESQENQIVNHNKQQKWFNIDFDLSQEQFLQKQQINYLEQSEEQLRQRIKNQEEKIKEFQQTFGQLLNFANKKIVNSNPVISTQSKNLFNERIIPESGSILPKGVLFPPGYTPPHLAKTFAPDGFASEQDLKFQANQSKKQKLRMGKQMLKLGYSVDEVLQRINEINFAQKSGKLQSKNPYIAPTQGPIRPFHIPRQNPKSMNFQKSLQAKKNENDKKVFERLIALLKQKRYKKLDQIQKHITNEGLQTSLQMLKRMLDDIKDKNAQKKIQNQ